LIVTAAYLFLRVVAVLVKPMRAAKKSDHNELVRQFVAAGLFPSE